MVSDEISTFISPVRVFSRDDVLSHPSPVPSQGGVYGWWFRRLPPLVVASGCCRHQDLTLLYAGISPNRPPGNGRPASRQNLLERIKYHYTGNAEGSTLRKTLGCLLAAELGIELRRVGSGNRMTFVEGEHALSAWMGENVYVSWVVRQQPWELEDYLIATLDLPLNLMGNQRNQFHPMLTETRAKCVARARDLPVLPNPGTGGLYRTSVPSLFRLTLIEVTKDANRCALKSQLNSRTAGPVTGANSSSCTTTSDRLGA